jgi:hypothetical protein
VDTLESGIVDQDLRQLSELNLSSRDPIGGFNLGDADASIWVKGDHYKISSLNFTLQQLHESDLLCRRWL